MSVRRVTNPTIALREFINRVAPYDPASTVGPVAVIEIRPGGATPVTGGARPGPGGATGVTFPLSGHLAEAVAAALASYRDHADRGGCGACGGRLDDNLHCPDCGRLHGVLGELLAERARRWPTGPIR